VTFKGKQVHTFYRGKTPRFTKKHWDCNYWEITGIKNNTCISIQTSLHGREGSCGCSRGCGNGGGGGGG